MNNNQTSTSLTATAQTSSRAGLGWAISTSLRQQGKNLDYTRLSDGLSQVMEHPTGLKDISKLLDTLGLNPNPTQLEYPDAAYLPLVGYLPQHGWGVVQERMPNGSWMFAQAEDTTSVEEESFSQTGALLLRIQPSSKGVGYTGSFADLLKSNLLSYRGVLFEAVLASFFINLLALAVSLFSMQVYDRVIPTRSDYTLIILATGVALVIIFEMIMKFSRSKIMDRVVVGLDQRLSREVFQRLLDVRVDQMPGSVGSMAAQLRGYEQVRSFYTASTLFALVDLPMAILFITIIGFIGSPLIALVPSIAAILAILYGLYNRRKIDLIAAEGAAASYRKTGILVEAVEGVETIKAGSGSWKFLSRWLDVMDITTKNDLDMRHANDYLSYGSQGLQQSSYVGIVIVGAYVVMSGDMTIGALIACSILGGRILAPVMAIPNLLVQHAHARAAQKNIEQLFSLQTDNHGVDRPLAPSKLKGHFVCDKMTFNYGENDTPAISIDRLEIRPGERIAILGPIGSGKSTLLRLLSGLYAPTTGRILVDGLDLSQISRETVSQQIGYLQQDHRLFQGTLRENLLIGMPDPGDDVLQEAMQRSGLIALVSNHSKGLDLPIMEGGKGLSGGQRQLVAFTRMILTSPLTMLLDEPTASMDDRQEQRCIKVLQQELSDTERGERTLVVATHKMPLLTLVNRLIIIVNNQIVMDGPRDAVLQKLKNNENAEAERTAVPNQDTGGKTKRRAHPVTHKASKKTKKP